MKLLNVTVSIMILMFCNDVFAAACPPGTVANGLGGCGTTEPTFPTHPHKAYGSGDVYGGSKIGTGGSKRSAKKKCLDRGGVFWEKSDGSSFCMEKLSAAKYKKNAGTQLLRGRKRRCFKAGGSWVTNSHGSFCWNPSR